MNLRNMVQVISLPLQRWPELTALYLGGTWDLDGQGHGTWTAKGMRREGQTFTGWKLMGLITDRIRPYVFVENMRTAEHCT